MRCETEPSSTGTGAGHPAPPLPTAPCSVVWSRGHAYTLEPVAGRPRWLGVDDRGHAVELSGADLQRRGWTRTCRR
jgi:hypothetical protein